MNMKNIFITIFLATSAISSFAQEVVEEENNYKISPRISNQNLDKPTKSIKLEKEELEKPNRDILNGNETDVKQNTQIKATRINDPKVKNEIIIDIDSQKSDLDNALVLIEEKENIHKYNSSLIDTDNYDLLLTKIAYFKDKFNKTVKTKGIENC